MWLPSLGINYVDLHRVNCYAKGRLELNIVKPNDFDALLASNIARFLIYLQTNSMHVLMLKKLLFTLMLGCGAVPFMVQQVNAMPGVEIIENDFSQISIELKGSTLRVAGAAGEDLYIYNITGVRVLSLRVDGNDKSYNLNLPKGCYIVKVGSVVRKISIR